MNEKEKETMQNAYEEATGIHRNLSRAIRQIETYMLELNKAQEMGKEKYDREMWHYGAYDDLVAQEETMKTVMPKCDRAMVLLIQAGSEAFKVMQIIRSEIETVSARVEDYVFEVNKALYFDVVCVLELLNPYIEQCALTASSIYQDMKESQAFNESDLATVEEWIHTLKELADYVNRLPKKERNEKKMKKEKETKKEEKEEKEYIDIQTTKRRKNVMEPYQVRMVKEYDETHRRLEKLIAALNKGVFSGEERLLADDQREAMTAYLRALRLRARLHGFDIITGQPIKHTEGGK